jgi:hypothetical protein
MMCLVVRRNWEERKGREIYRRFVVLFGVKEKVEKYKRQKYI